MTVPCLRHGTTALYSESTCQTTTTSRRRAETPQSKARLRVIHQVNDLSPFRFAFLTTEGNPPATGEFPVSVYEGGTPVLIDTTKRTEEKGGHR